MSHLFLKTKTPAINEQVSRFGFQELKGQTNSSDFKGHTLLRFIFFEWTLEN